MNFYVVANGSVFSVMVGIVPNAVEVIALPRLDDAQNAAEQLNTVRLNFAEAQLSEYLANRKRPE